MLADLGSKLDESLGAMDRTRRDMEEQHQRTMQQSAEHAEKLVEALASRLQDTLVSIAEKFERHEARSPSRHAPDDQRTGGGDKPSNHRRIDDHQMDDDESDSSGDDRGGDDDVSGDDDDDVGDVITRRAEKITAAERLRVAASTRPYGAVFAQHIAPAASVHGGPKLVDVNPKHRRRAAALDIIAEQDGHPLDRALGRASEDAENLRRLVRDLETHSREAWSPSMSKARDAQGMETEWPKIKGANEKTNTHVRKLLQPVGTMLMQAEQVQRAAIIAIATGTVFNSLEDALDALWLVRQAMVSCWALLDYDYSLRAAETLPQQMGDVARAKLMERAARVANPYLDARRREEQRCAREDAILAAAFGTSAVTAYQAGQADGGRKQARKHGGGSVHVAKGNSNNNNSKGNSSSSSTDSSSNNSNSSSSTNSTSYSSSSNNNSNNKNSKYSNNNSRKTDNKAGAADAAPASG